MICWILLQAQIQTWIQLQIVLVKIKMIILRPIHLKIAIFNNQFNLKKGNDFKQCTLIFILNIFFINIINEHFLYILRMLDICGNFLFIK